MFPFHHFNSAFSPQPGEFILNVTANVANPNLRQMAIDTGWNATSKVKVNITAPLVNTINLPAGTSFPGGIELVISAGTRVGGVYNSGNAINVGIPVVIDNLGIISGGGGVGGGGQGVYVTPYPPGNEGQYFVNGGSGGLGQGFGGPSSLSITGPYGGNAGPEIYGPNKAFGTGGNGGTGGGWGQSGYSGGWGNYSAGGEWYPATAGAPPGKYVNGNSFVTWKGTGTRLGLVS